MVEELFASFDCFLKDKGYLAMGKQIIDATIVPAPKQHNSREENETQGRQDNGRLEIHASQEALEGQGRTVDEEGRATVLRLQEPRKMLRSSARLLS